MKNDEDSALLKPIKKCQEKKQHKVIKFPT